MKTWQRLAALCYKAAHYCDAKAGIKPIFGKRICSGCGKGVGRHDHWHFVNGSVRHWNCALPQKMLGAQLHKMVTEDLQP